MDFNLILQSISTVGFPIVACGAMFWKINKQDEQHQQEMDSLRTALENNTYAVIELQQTLKKTDEPTGSTVEHRG